MTQGPSLARRSVLKTLGGIGAAIGMGGTGLFLASNRGAAASGTLNISDASAVTTDDGQVKFVDVSLTHTVKWNGFDVPVAAVAWRDNIVVRPNSENPYTHQLHDGISHQGGPTLLANFSSRGSGGDGWGGPDEYASQKLGTYDRADGPTDQGYVHAGIDWRILSDGGDSEDALSIENPGNLNDTNIEPATDGETRQSKIKYTKKVFLFREDSNGSYTSQDGSTTLALMGDDDGTVKVVPATGTFTITITNEGATTSTSGSGSSEVGT